MKKLLSNFKYKRMMNKLSVLPTKVGIKNNVYQLLEERIETAFPLNYQRYVLDRAKKFHKLSEEEAQLALVELKRYFILTSLYKGVPMYSDKVDILWHEMLMFTKHYDQFCEDFVGRKIHHVPEVASTKKVQTEEEKMMENYNKRILFEIIYQHLFNTTSFSHYFWGELYEEVPDNFNRIVEQYYKNYDNEESNRLLEEIKGLE